MLTNGMITNGMFKGFPCIYVYSVAHTPRSLVSALMALARAHRTSIDHGDTTRAGEQQTLIDGLRTTLKQLECKPA